MTDWRAYNAAGWRAINKGYYDTAEHEFLASIKIAKRELINEPPLMARSYADYAWALQKQGRNGEAEPLLKWALLARERSLEPTASAIPQTLNQLATLYYDMGRFADAEPILHRALDLQASTPKANLQEFARSRTLMGLLFSAQRRYAEAEPHFARALELREKAQGSSNPETGDALANLAWTYHAQGKDDEARPLFTQALQIFERSRGMSDTSVAHVSSGLAEILARERKNKGASAEAESHFRRAIAIWEKMKYEEPSLLEVLRHYADFLEEHGRTDDLKKVKDQIAPLRARYTLTEAQLGRRYRFPEATAGPPSTRGPGGGSPAPVPG